MNTDRMVETLEYIAVIIRTGKQQLPTRCITSRFTEIGRRHAKECMS
nr:MAG TPA: hypothetical protein [Caudoviricetes sp.]